MLALRSAARLLARSAQVGTRALRRPLGRPALPAATRGGLVVIRSMASGGEPAHTNRLAKEQSPCERPAACARQAVNRGHVGTRSRPPIEVWRVGGPAPPPPPPDRRSGAPLPLAFSQTCCSMPTTRWTGTPGALVLADGWGGCGRDAGRSCPPPGSAPQPPPAAAPPNHHRLGRGEEAFEKARREDKPIFLSVGYSTCHWCHVMERESFESEEVAALM